MPVQFFSGAGGASDLPSFLWLRLLQVNLLSLIAILLLLFAVFIIKKVYLSLPSEGVDRIRENDLRDGQADLEKNRITMKSLQ